MNLRRIDVAVVFSLLVHGLIAALPQIRKPELDGGVAAPAFIAQLVDAPKAEIVPQPAPVIPKPVPVAKPRPIVAPRIVAAAPSIAIPVERVPEPVERVEPHPEPQFDMMAMINARREQRHAIEEAMLQQARARDGASAPDQALAAINRNLSTLTSDRDGTGGVFTILSMGQRTGEFSFNGWQPEIHKTWREVIEVRASVGVDLELAMVRRMIELIRSHYTGDFNWKSHRLDKVITLSARAEDQAQLEEFLRREFFGTPTLAHKP